MACCPAHDDSTASLSVDVADDGRLLVWCGAGCTFEAIRAALGAEVGEFFPLKDRDVKQIEATYDYKDEAGVLLYQVVRFEPKDFRNRRPDGKGDWVWALGDARRVLYGLPELKANNDSTKPRPVFVVEGEKDVEAARRFGLVATTNLGGAGKWHPGSMISETLRDRIVYIIPDNDEPGVKHAAAVKDALDGIAESVLIVPLPGVPEHGDLSDWIAAGGDLMALRALLSAVKLGVTPPPLPPLPPKAAPEPPPASPAGALLAQLVQQAGEILNTVAKLKTVLEAKQ